MAKKIVVVDDEPDILKVVVFRLKKIGYDVLSAVDGKSGLELIRSEKPDLAILDYRLPDTNGLELCKTIRGDSAVSAMPVILLSASSGGDISRALKDAAINEYVKKPFELEELLAAIKKYV